MKKLFNKFSILIILLCLVFSSCSSDEESPRPIIPKLEPQVLFDEAKALSLSNTIKQADIDSLKSKFNALKNSLKSEKAGAKNVGHLAGIIDNKKNTFLHLLLIIAEHADVVDLIRDYLNEVKNLTTLEKNKQYAVNDDGNSAKALAEKTKKPEIIALFVDSVIDPNDIKTNNKLDVSQFNELLKGQKAVENYEKLNAENKTEWQKYVLDHEDDKSIEAFKNVYEGMPETNTKEDLRNALLDNYFTKDKIMDLLENAGKWGVVADLINQNNTFKMPKTDNSGDYEGNFLYVVLSKKSEDNHALDDKFVHDISNKIKEKIVDYDEYNIYLHGDPSVYKLVKNSENNSDLKSKYLLSLSKDIDLEDLLEEDVNNDIFSWAYNNSIKEDHAKLDALKNDVVLKLLAIIVNKSLDAKVYAILADFINALGDKAPGLIANSKALGILFGDRTGKNDSPQSLKEAILLLVEKADGIGIRAVNNPKILLDFLTENKKEDLFQKVFDAFRDLKKGSNEDFAADESLVDWSLDNKAPRFLRSFYIGSGDPHKIFIKNKLIMKAYGQSDSESLNRVAETLNEAFLVPQAIKDGKWTLRKDKTESILRRNNLLRELLLKFLIDMGKDKLNEEMVQKLARAIKRNGNFNDDEWKEFLSISRETGGINKKDNHPIGALSKDSNGPKIGEDTAKIWLLYEPELGN